MTGSVAYTHEGEGKRNASIDLVRFLMALLIVAMHCNFLADVNVQLSYLISIVTARLAVPFFAVVSGYFFFHITSPASYQHILFRYIRPYLLWEFIYILYRYAFGKIGGGREILEEIFLHGFWHLWYMLAIIYTVAILIVVRRWKESFRIIYYSSFAFLLLGIMMYEYGKIAYSLPIIKLTLGRLNPNNNIENQWLTIVVPFFMMGYHLNHSRYRDMLLYKKCEYLLPAAFVIYVCEVILIKILNLDRSPVIVMMTYPLVYLIFIFCLKHPDGCSIRIAKYFAEIASIMYFSHILFVLIFQNVGLSETLVFVLTVASCIVLSVLMGVIRHSLTSKRKKILQV